MNQTIFISCGQFTDAERSLGKNIYAMVQKLTPFKPFFAQEVQDLNGLDDNILQALHECVAFITVLHPRGDIIRPDGSKLTRASIWIEQEIAIATYIKRTEKRDLPIIAFKHKSVGLEGIRTLLNLNPTEFTNEAEVLAELPNRLAAWKSLKPSGIELRLTSRPAQAQQGHTIFELELTLVNDTTKRIPEYTFELRIPAALLKHWNTVYPVEVPSEDRTLRRFRADQSYTLAVGPRAKVRLIGFECCNTCAFEEHGKIGALVAEATINATAWIDGEEYTVERTIKQLALERTD